MDLALYEMYRRAKKRPMTLGTMAPGIMKGIEEENEKKKQEKRSVLANLVKYGGKEQAFMTEKPSTLQRLLGIGSALEEKEMSPYKSALETFGKREQKEPEVPFRRDETPSYLGELGSKQLSEERKFGLEKEKVENLDQYRRDTVRIKGILADAQAEHLKTVDEARKESNNDENAYLKSMDIKIGSKQRRLSNMIRDTSYEYLNEQSRREYDVLEESIRLDEQELAQRSQNYKKPAGGAGKRPISVLIPPKK